MRHLPMHRDSLRGDLPQLRLQSSSSSCSLCLAISFRLFAVLSLKRWRSLAPVFPMQSCGFSATVEAPRWYPSSPSCAELSPETRLRGGISTCSCAGYWEPCAFSRVRSSPVVNSTLVHAALPCESPVPCSLAQQPLGSALCLHPPVGSAPQPEVRPLGNPPPALRMASAGLGPYLTAGLLKRLG